MTYFLMFAAVYFLTDAGISMAKSLGWTPAPVSEGMHSFSALVGIGIGIWAIVLLMKVGA